MRLCAFFDFVDQDRIQMRALRARDIESFVFEHRDLRGSYRSRVGDSPVNRERFI